MRIIAGRWKGRRLRPLRGRGVRPTTDRVREAWMSAVGAGVEDARVLDLFAGSGALGLEALSRGAASVVFVERARAALAALRANVDLLGANERCRVVSADAFAYLRRVEKDAEEAVAPFDLALADPPYGTGDAARLVALFQEKPFAKALWLEHPTRERLPLPESARTRRYGDTALTTLLADP